MLRLVANFDGEVRLRPVAADEEIVVGSAATSDWALPFPGVSRRHARIARTDRGVEIHDLGSKNGVVIGGERVDRALVRPGETAVLGRATVVLEEVSSAEVELALATGKDTRSRSASVVERGTAPLIAIRLARDLDRLSESLAEAERSEILGRIVETVGAEALWTFAEAAEDLFLRDCVGAVPGDETLERIESARRRLAEAGERGVEGIGFDTWSGTGLLFRPVEDEVLVAVLFPADEERPPAWVSELLEHLARKLVREQTPERRRTHGRSAWPGGPTETLRLPDGMVQGRSQAIRGLLGHLKAAARSDLHVLLLGETGTGKELFARALHTSSSAREGPFVPINCAAIPAEMLEAELFGVAARVATGVDPRPGRFVQASGGTLFLDEIGELPDRLQAKLLRVLQEREVLPVGGDRPRPIDARIVSASNADLREDLLSGKFRRDLYHRVSGMELHVPPLRDRVEDIPELVLVFVQRCAEKYDRRIRGVSRRALSLLMAYEWPGNIRELENAVERAVLLCPDGGALESGHFGPVQWAVERGSRGEPPFRHYSSSPPAEDASPDLPPPAAEHFRPLQERIDAVEIQAIREALTLTQGNKTRAAELLGITPNGLRMKMRRLALR